MVPLFAVFKKYNLNHQWNYFIYRLLQFLLKKHWDILFQHFVKMLLKSKNWTYVRLCLCFTVNWPFFPPLYIFCMLFNKNKKQEGLRPGDLTSTFCGTPNYIAPEMLRGDDYGRDHHDPSLWDVTPFFFWWWCIISSETLVAANLSSKNDGFFSAMFYYFFSTNISPPPPYCSCMYISSLCDFTCDWFWSREK